MRVAVVYFPSGNREKIAKISKALAQGIESQGHQVDIIDAAMDVNSKLSVYQYVAVGVQFSSFFSSKLPDLVNRYLKNAGMVAGKRCFAFILPRTILGGKSLTNLMSAMEGEGMFMKFSDIISDEAVAREIGKKLAID
jgi:flavodoxin